MSRNLALYEVQSSVRFQRQLLANPHQGVVAMTGQRLAPTHSLGFPQTDPRDAATLSLLGHDLRAALSEVIAGLRLVDTAVLDAANREMIARTRAASDALSLLLDQALAMMLGDSNAIDAGQSLLQTDRLLDSIRLRWHGRAVENGLEFRLLAADLPAQLHIDGALIERVLSNLLGNAIKFASTGCVTCKISLAGDRLAIAVSDQGPGFAENALPRLFEVNSRPENASKPGTGLGLHIVRDMVDRAGGSISARNLPKGGAEVAVQLPLPARNLRSYAPEIAPNIPDLSRFRVLLADDSATSRLILQHHLGHMGAEVVLATDGVEALGRLERESFDLLVIDIEMPRMPGLDVIRHLRQMTGPLAQLPVLAITAHSGDAMRRSIVAAGATVTVLKPVASLTAFGAAVAAALQGRLSATPDIDPAQFDRLLAMAGPATAAELMDRLLEDLRGSERRLTAARSGPDWASIQAQTHILIAIAGTAGGFRLQHLAEKLNQLAQEPQQQGQSMATLWPDIMAELHRLIAFVAGKADMRGGGHANHG